MAGDLQDVVVLIGKLIGDKSQKLHVTKTVAGDRAICLGTKIDSESALRVAEGGRRHVPRSDKGVRNDDTLQPRGQGHAQGVTLRDAGWEHELPVVAVLLSFVDPGRGANREFEPGLGLTRRVERRSGRARARALSEALEARVPCVFFFAGNESALQMSKATCGAKRTDSKARRASLGNLGAALVVALALVEEGELPEVG